jgi:plasmid replication initiation protein
MPAKAKSSQPDFTILEGKYYSKSNALVNAKGKGSLLSQKLFAVGIQQAEKDEKTGIISSTLYGTDLRMIFGAKNGSFYDQIKEVVQPLKGKPSLLDYRLVYADDATEKVEAINVITDCSFEDGILIIRYNTKVNDDIYRLKSNYTTYALSETMGLKSIYSFRLYEILKAEYDKQSYVAHKNGRNLNNEKAYVLEINLTDLKLRLGIIDPSIDKDILKVIQSDNPDYDLVEELAKEQKDGRKYAKVSNLKTYALNRAQKELAEKTSLSFDYEEIKAGRGGKIIGIRFFIRLKSKEKKDIIDITPEMTEEMKENVIDEINDYIDEKVKIKDLKTIAEEAGYDIDRIKKQYDLMKKKKNKVDDIVAYLIKAIRNDYSEPVSKKNSFGNFEQLQYDFDDLESKIIDN